MDIENADSFDRRSLCSLRSQQSLQHYRMLSLHRSLSHDGDGTVTNTTSAAAATAAVVAGTGPVSSSHPNNHNAADETSSRA
jgi:hypothetical protein